mmetsp:Transcript_19747/g.27405  ORF Transcript_19747/g.27405 Transcript_19747/m.27405 type:complete len:548 (-) Transcript_19747:78-1721(-)
MFGSGISGMGLVGKGLNGGGSGGVRRSGGNEATKGPDVKSRSDSNIILFDCSKNEAFTPNDGLKTFHRKLRKQYQVKINKDDLAEDTLAGARAIIMAAPTAKFEASEIKALKSFLSEGGSMLILAQEGGETTPNQYISKLTSEYGINVNNDAVVRTAYRKDYFHPKEVYIRKASLTSELDMYAGKASGSGSGGNDFASNEDNDDEEDDQDIDSSSTGGGTGGKLDLIYPFGCTLNVDKPAMPLVTSGKMSFPANRALVAASKMNNKGDGGLMLVVGSARVFHDKFLHKEDNSAFVEGCVKMLMAKEDAKIGTVDNDRPEYKDAVQVPDMEALAERLRCCLQEPEEMPSDFSRMFDLKMFSYHTDLVPESVKLYERLNVKHEPLSLIPPQFEVPLPPLQPAVFLPCMRDLPPPALDLFDLDQQFSGETVQLAQLTNKCSERDLDYYVVNAGRILDVTSKIDVNNGSEMAGERKEITAKQILEHIFKELVNYKKMDSDGGPSGRDSTSKNTNPLLANSPKSAESKEMMRSSRQSSAGHSRPIPGASFNS